ncbi:MAG: ABC transporter permease subunit [Isosphaeraceae bacterium]
MPFRSGPGPVFVFESIVVARRWQSYALRSLFVASLLACLAFAWSSLNETPASIAARGSLRELAWLGQRIYSMIAGVQLTLVLLAAPAATAGAICLDRARGTLSHMLVTDLSDREIVLGKLAARLLPVAALVGSGVPVLALAGLLGGIIPEALMTLTLVSAGVAVFGCSLALIFSVRATKSQEVLMAVYAIEAVWLLSLPLWEMFAAAGSASRPPLWFQALNPYFLVYAPYVWPQMIGVFEVSLLLVILAVGSLALTVASVVLLRVEPRTNVPRRRLWGPRWSLVRQRLFSWWPTPELDGNPVLWREWLRNHPSRLGRLVILGYLTAVCVGMTIGISNTIRFGMTNGPDFLVLTNFLAVGFGLLLLAAAAPTTLAEERVRGSLDVLLSTPLTTLSIVMGKWLAVFFRGLPLLLLPAVTGVFVASCAPDLPPWVNARFQPTPIPIGLGDRLAAAFYPVAFALAHVATVTSYGLAAGTWIKRPGRAVATSVAIYVFSAVGWIFLVEVVLADLVWKFLTQLMPGTFGSSPATWGNAMMVVNQLMIVPSPLGSQVTPYENLQQYWISSQRSTIWFVMGLEVVGLFALAAVILGLVLLTFNRCMGRMDEITVPPPRRALPPRHNPPSSDEEDLEALVSFEAR